MTATIDFAQLQVGDALPAWVLAIDATRIVAGAIATRDFMPVHHDRDYANQQGAPDIFVNILSDTAMCSRYLTDWAGPNAMVRKLAIRLGVPLHPGHTLTFTGRIVATSVEGDEGIVAIEFTGTNEMGEHVGGTATIGLPVTGVRP